MINPLIIYYSSKGSHEEGLSSVISDESCLKVALLFVVVVVVVVSLVVAELSVVLEELLVKDTVARNLSWDSKVGEGVSEGLLK